MSLASKKRRPETKSASKHKSSSLKSVKKPEPASRSWLFEIFAISFLALSIFLLLSVLSVELSIMYPEHSFWRRDLLGPIGKLIGTLMRGGLGLCAFIPSLWLGFVALHFWLLVKNKQTDSFSVVSKPLLLTGLLGSLLSLTILAQVYLRNNAGGSVGRTLAEPLILLFNNTGATILAGALFVVSFAFTSQKNTIDLAAAFLKICKLAGIIIFVKTPTIFFYSTLNTLIILTAVVRYCFQLIYKFLSWLLFRKSEVITERPLRQRVKRLKEDDISDTEVSPIQTKDDYTHVVVKRRDRLQQAEAKKRKNNKTDLTSATYQQAGKVYKGPDIALLTPGEASLSGEDDETLRKKSRLIESKLQDFGILGRVTHVHPGPVITLFEFEPAAGVKVGRITSLQDDLAMSLRAVAIRIIAPIPQRGTVGIEVPNTHRDLVRLRDCLESEAFISTSSSLTVPIGKDTYGEPVVADIASMPHLLVAGATGTGKSVFINSLLVSLLYRANPMDLGLILIDPKILELSVYENIPHLRAPVVTVPRQAKAVLDWAVKEMERRYRLMHRYGVRSIDGFNDLARGQAPSAPEQRAPEDEVLTLEEDQIVAEGTIDKTKDDEVIEIPAGAELLEPLPKLVIVIDELADLMLTVGREIEESITRLAQKARAAGIHLIVATQRPSVDVITGLIKANFPARIAFRVTSRIDSRTILDNMGAERLLGRGDMLFMRPGAQHVLRVHGAFLSDREVNDVVAQMREWGAPQYDPGIVAACEKALQDETNTANDAESGDSEYDELYDKAVEVVIQNGKASTSMIQRAFRIGYNRAARIIEMMEREGVIGPMDGAKPREVLGRKGEEVEY